MKHGNATEYDHAKRRAEFARARERARRSPEVDEEAADRIAGKLLALKEQMAKENVAEAKRREEAEARATAHTLRANKMCALREWQSAGFKPPFVDADGFPTMSLSFMLSIGWEFRDGENGEKLLVKPPPKPKRKTKEEWERERAEEQQDQLKGTF